MQGIWAFSGPRLEPIRVQPIPLLPLQPLCRCPADLARKRRIPRLSSPALDFRLLAHPLSPPRFDSSLLLGFLTPLHRLPWQTKPTERCVPVPGGSRPCHVSLLNFFHFFSLRCLVKVPCFAHVQAFMELQSRMIDTTAKIKQVAPFFPLSDPFHRFRSCLILGLFSCLGLCLSRRLKL